MTSPIALQHFQDQLVAIRRSTSRIFGYLIVAEYVAAVVWSAIATPLTWTGGQSSAHPHVLAAALLGGLIALPTAYIALTRPAASLTPWIVCVAQMLMSALLIHASGGRTETHFQIFGSLAFIAFYRDWRLLAPATLLVAVDHIIRGIYAPGSIYGVTSGAEWRFIEHATWVLFEDVILVAGCQRGLKEMRLIAERHSQLERTNVELKAAKDRADLANMAKSHFLSRMSHELRTPMNAILGFGQLLELSDMDDKQQESLKHIMKGGRHLLGLINDVLEISSIEVGGMTVSIEPVNLSEALSDSISLMRSQADQKKMTLEYECPEELYVQTDRRRIRQVLLNLISNGIKYNSPGGEVRVTATPNGEGAVVLKVQDNGPGIPEAMLERLFVPFDRLGAEQKGEEGTGLGLPLTKSLVEAMGGSLAVASEEGRGTTFSVLLSEAQRPVIDDPQSLELLAVLRPSSSPTIKVLAIEDNSANTELLRGVFATRPGLQLITATSGIAGLQLAAQHHPDVILLDLHLPDMEGREVLDSLRSDPVLKTIRVIVATADTFSSATALKERGAFRCLSKPYVIGDLVSSLDAALESRQAVRAA